MPKDLLLEGDPSAQNNVPLDDSYPSRVPMLLLSLIFLLGDLSLQCFSHIPSFFWGGAILCLILYFQKHIKISIYLIAFLCGFLYVSWYANFQLSRTLPKELEGKTLTIQGTIASIPSADQQQTKFLFSLNKINNTTFHGLIHLSWHQVYEKLIVGDQWKLIVRLKRIHGLSNPGGFDYESWALQEGIHATGYVMPKAQNELLTHQLTFSIIDRLRQHIKEKIDTHLPTSQTSRWITALAIGERQGISQENWEVLRNTGTNHLMAIAGLHVGVMSGLMYFLISFFWRQISCLTRKLPAQHAGAVAALIMSFLYSALAGFSIPTQRACIMMSVFFIAVLLKRKIISWQGWSVALMFVLLLNPLCILTESFWLSFGSVALIIYGVSGRLNPKGLWWKWGRIQWVITIGLIPLCIWLFQQCSLVSFIANAVAIPWVAFIIVPLTLLGCLSIFISGKLGSCILVLADINLNYLWKILSYLSHFQWAVWYQSIPHQWMILSACVGVILLLLPQGFPGRWLGLIWMLPIILFKPIPPKLGEMKFTLLDVGQGLSAVVQTHNHVVVFDAGARFNENYDMGNSVVIPFLRSEGIKTIDMLVVSHGDNDHIGGVNAILKQMKVRDIRSSVPEKMISNQASYCLQNQSWDWDEVHFQFLYPSIDKLHLGNDSSCVLKVSVHNKSVLLTGDIEKAAEKYLISNKNNGLHSDVLVAPHHGSKTSAEVNFIKAVNPKYVLFPVGYRNRYHFPNQSVIEIYQSLSIPIFDTVNSGSIQLVIADGRLLNPELHRISHAHLAAKSFTINNLKYYNFS